jgi:hypothetical protein
MAFTLQNPLPAALDLDAPLVGRWFGTGGGPGGAPAAVKLPAVSGGDFGLPITLSANDAWLAPALGTMSLYVVGGSSVPLPIAHLRNAAGASPFTSQQQNPPKNVVAVFTLLPGVAQRLYDLTRFIPSITGTATAVTTTVGGASYAGDAAPTRVKVTTFALVLNGVNNIGVNGVNGLWQMMPDVNPSPFDQQIQNDPQKLIAAKAGFLGLTADANGVLGNSPSPMAWMRRPGAYQAPAVLDPREDRLLIMSAPQNCTLWAFDDRGRPVDPGAVAAWWSLLMTSMLLPANTLRAGVAQMGNPAVNLFPNKNGYQVVCDYFAGFSAHLVNAHEGPLASPFIGAQGRLQSGSPAAPVTSNVLTNGGASLALQFSAYTNSNSGPTANMNPTPDKAPQARLAVLPNGAYTAAASGSPMTLWKPGKLVSDVAAFDRDFTRVAVVDIEHHLVGLERIDTTNPAPSGDLQIHQADQNRPSTRVTVGPIAVPAGGAVPQVLLQSNDQVTGAAMAVLAATAAAATGGGAAPPPSRIVVPAIDEQWGPTPPLPDLSTRPGAPTPPFPGQIPPAPPQIPAQFVEHPGDGTALVAGEYRVHPLVGDSTDGTTVGQMVLLEVCVPAGPQGLFGAWLRAWPLGFDVKAALHRRMVGGAGMVDQFGTARLVMTLPFDNNDNAAQNGFDLTIAFTWFGRPVSLSFGDLRFARPQAPGGAAKAVGANATTVHICEQGLTFNPTQAAVTPSIPSGATLVNQIGAAPNETYSLIDRTTLWTTPATMGAAQQTTLRMSTPPGTAMVMLTQPACQLEADAVDPIFRPQPSSSSTDPTGNLINLTPATGNPFVFDRVARNPIAAGVRSSYPFRGCERLEVAATHELPGAGGAAGTITGMIGSVSWLPRNQEQSFHHLGHPGEPASSDICGTGAALTGRAAVPLLEYTHERTAGIGLLPANTPAVVNMFVVQSEAALAVDAITVGTSAAGPITPAAPAVPVPWAAVLRTCARELEGIPFLTSDLLGNVFPVSDKLVDLQNWLVNGLDSITPSQVSGPLGSGVGTTLLGALPAAVGPVRTFVERALDQRLRTKARGARDTAFALIAALGRAEDLVYIESPAIDDEKFGSDDNQIGLWDTLKSRLQMQSSLRVVVCLPRRLGPSLPQALQDMRDHLLIAAVKSLRDGNEDRVAVFTPCAGGDRALYLASTTVIVDDVFALTGTTHLWRRGLTFDSSLACSVFDENVRNGRCTEVARFRNALMARRLGVPVGVLPEHPGDLMAAIRDLDHRGSARLSAIPIMPPTGQPDGWPTAFDKALWNADGTVPDQAQAIEAAIAGILGFTTPFNDDNPSGGN